MKRKLLIRLRVFFIFIFLFTVIFAFAQPDTIKIDLGDPANTCPSPWNNLSDPSVGTISDCLNTKGENTGISIAVTDDFKGYVGYGEAANDSLNLTDEATTDSFWGRNKDNATGGLTFSNLDPSNTYSFAFFGCRYDVPENRETQFDVVGNSQGTAALNVSNNVDYMTRVNNISPKADGTITITVSAGPNNELADPTFYVGAIEMTWGGGSTTVTDNEAPTTPIGISSFSVGKTSFTLKWAASTDNVGVTGYDVFLNGNSIGVTSDTSTFVSGLICNTTYSITVKAVDSAGNWSAESTSQEVTTSSCEDNPNAPIDTIKIDLGTVESASPSPWNNITSYLKGAKINNCLNSIGISTSVSVILSDGFRGVTTSGTTTPNPDLNLDGNVSSDSFWGKDDGDISQLTFSNLDPAKKYDFTFFGSRISLSETENRDTKFIVTGSNEGTDSLNIANNVDNIAEVNNIYPKSDGTIIITVSAAADNNNSQKLYQLGTVIMTYEGIADTESPSIPTGLSVLDLGANSFNLNWGASTDNIGVAKYEVFKDGTSIGTTTETNMIVSTLSCSATYSMTVKAMDVSSNWSESSAALDVTTATCGVNRVVNIDFGDPELMSPSPWNNLCDPISGVILNCLDVDGVGTGISVEVTDGFSGYYIGGASANDSLSLVDEASTDCFYGSGTDGAMTFSYLDPSKAYSFAFFGSRDEVNNIRETKYVVEGITTKTANLNTANNSDNRVWLHNIYPKSDGTINVTISRGPNDEAKVIYLNALTIIYERGEEERDTVPPTAPTELSVSNVTAYSFDLRWKESTDSSGRIPGYEVLLDGVPMGQTSKTTLHVTKLIPNTSYKVTVKAMDASANWSETSSSLDVTTSETWMLPKDDDGWSIVQPSADSRLIYVSNSGYDETAKPYSLSEVGNDPHDPSISVNAYASIDEAIKQIRDGYPDWVLFKCGDSWVCNTIEMNSIGNGRSANERLVFTYYGTSGNRPIIKTSDKPIKCWATSKGLPYSHDWAFIGLEYYGYKADPNSPDYTSVATHTPITDILNSGYNLLFEDCHFNFTELYINPDPGKSWYNIEIRRNILTDTYYANSCSDKSNKPSAALICGVYNYLIEENMVDHSGWNEDISGAGRNMYNHGFYLQYDNSGELIFRGNIMSRCAANAVQNRSGGVVEKNLVIQCPAGLMLAHDTKHGPSANDGITCSRYNVITEGLGMGDCGWASSAHWGMPLDATLEEGTIIEENIVAHNFDEEGSIVAIHNVSSASYLNNIVYDFDPNQDIWDNSWLDPERTVASYNETIGGLDSTEEFIESARNRNLHEWPEELSAYAVINYFREGFNLDPITSGSVEIPVTGVDVSPSSLTINGTESSLLIKTISPAEASDNRVTWSSSNIDVATVSATGLVTGVSPGSAIIKVITKDGGYTDSCSVTVTDVSITGVTLDKLLLTVQKGSLAQLTETLLPVNTTETNVTWSSSNSTVATVDAEGMITGISEGTATITVTTDVGNYTASCEVTVTGTKVLEVNPSQVDVVIDGNAAEWETMVAVPVSMLLSGDAIPASTDLEASFKACWDTNALYLMVDIADDILVSSAPDSWNNDLVEIAVDGNADRDYNVLSNSQTSDFKLISVYGYNQSAVESNSSNFDVTERDLTGFEYAPINRTGGWGFELKLPGSAVSEDVTFTTGSELVVELAVGDNDEGSSGSRETILSWSGRSNLNSDATQFGTFVLKGIPTSSTTMEMSDQTCRVYPNPFSDEIRFELNSNKSGHLTINLYNQLGVKVARIFDGNLPEGSKNTVDFNGCSLVSGIYYYQVISGNGNISTGRLVKN